MVFEVYEARVTKARCQCLRYSLFFNKITLEERTEVDELLLDESAISFFGVANCSLTRMCTSSFSTPVVTPVTVILRGSQSKKHSPLLIVKKSELFPKNGVERV